MQKIKKGDEVIVLTGKYKGKRGTVLRTLLDKKRAYVEGIQLVKKHTKPNPQLNQPGGIIEKEAPIHLSNIAIYNTVTQKADRIRIKTLEDGKRVRRFVSNGELIDV